MSGEKGVRDSLRICKMFSRKWFRFRCLAVASAIQFGQGKSETETRTFGSD